MLVGLCFVVLVPILFHSFGFVSCRFVSFHFISLLELPTFISSSYYRVCIYSKAGKFRTRGNFGQSSSSTNNTLTTLTTRRMRRYLKKYGLHVSLPIVSCFEMIHRQRKADILF